MRRILAWPAMALAFLLSACSTAQMYDSLQTSARNNCEKMQGADRAACLDRNKDSYDTYKKKRDGALSAPNKS